MSSPTTIAYLPTALGVSKATLLLDNVASSGPYAWQLPQCTITSNPYGGYTGTFGLFNCIAIQNGAISAIVWFYLPPGGIGTLLSFQSAQYPYSSSLYNSWSYVGTDRNLYVRDGNIGWISTPISPGWHIAVFEE